MMTMEQLRKLCHQYSECRDCPLRYDCNEHNLWVHIIDYEELIPILKKYDVFEFDSDGGAYIRE